MKKPNKIQTVLSVASCKLTRGILRKTGRGGTALPGIVAMKVAKNILAVPASEMDIVVAGLRYKLARQAPEPLCGS